MSKINYIRKTLLQVVFITSVLLFASCGLSPKNADSKDVADDNNNSDFDTNKQRQDAQFLVNAAEINLEEIQLGQLAQQNGKTTHVKELGEKMEALHSKSLNDLKAIAKSKMIALPKLPTDKAQETYKKINEKSGADFDKAYADMMVSEHKDAIAAFEKISTDGNDKNIKDWATVSLADLRTHLDYSIDCQKKCKKL